MPMYWTFNCFLGCIYTVYYIVHIVFLVLNWLSNLELRLPKKEDQVARIGVRGGGGFRWFGQCPKENVFFSIEAFPNVEESCLEGPTWNRENMNNKEVATTSSGCKFWQTNPLVLLWYIKCQDQSVSSACSGLHHSLILCTLYPKFCVCAWHKLEIWVGTGGQKYECCE